MDFDLIFYFRKQNLYSDNIKSVFAEFDSKKLEILFPNLFFFIATFFISEKYDILKIKSMLKLKLNITCIIEIKFFF